MAGIGGDGLERRLRHGGKERARVRAMGNDGGDFGKGRIYRGVGEGGRRKVSAFTSR